jgi:putative ABC transport system permease protein
VVTQIAASLALVISTGLLVRALSQLLDTHPGFATENMLAFRTSLPMPKYAETARRERFYSTVMEELRSLPGVRAAAVISFRPMGDFRGGIWPLILPGKSREPYASARFVTPGYFSTMRIPLLRGRAIQPSDRPGSQRVAVVSESFIDEHWPGENGIGRTFGIPFGDLKFTIVGVVANVRFRGLESRSEPQMYFASAQTPDNAFTWFAPKDFVVATTRNPLQLVPAIRKIVASADPIQPVSEVQTLNELVLDDTAGRRTQLWVIGAFAVAAFTLAGIGIHGLLSFAVSQRTQEIGLRRALGAQTRDIAGLVVGEAMLLVLVGSSIGIVTAYLVGRGMETLLLGVGPADGVTLGAAVLLALIMAACGTMVPAIRALRVDPASALRAE